MIAPARAAGVAGALLLAASARAWEPEELGPVRLDEPVRALAVLEGPGGPLIAVAGPTRTRVLTPGGAVVAEIPRGASALALADVDVDGAPDLLLCGPEGLWAVEPGDLALRPLLERPCDAVAVVRDPELGPALAVASGQLRLYTPGPDGLVDRGPRGNFAGAPHLAATSSRWASADGAGARVAVHGAAGREELLAAGPVGGLTGGASGFSWTVPGLGLVEAEGGRAWRVGGAPAQVLSARLDLDDAPDLVVLDPVAGIVGVVAGVGDGRAERFFLEGPSAVARADLDGDRCEDLVIGFRDQPGITVLYTRPCARAPIAPPAPAPASPSLSGTAPYAGPAPVPVARALGVKVPSFLGRRNATAPERLRRQRYVIVGSGWAMGSTLRNVWFQIPFFPALSVGMEGGGPHVRWFVGGDSAALFFWVIEGGGGGIHLANLSAGVTFGSPRLRAGPFATAGLIAAGAGLRTVFTPWADGWNTFKGVELRLTWFYPATGEVMLLYVWSQPTRSADRPARGLPSAPVDPVLPGWTALDVDPEQARADGADLPAYAPIREGRGRARLGCHRFSAGLGAAVGASSTRFSWEFVGTDVPLTASASPALSLGCESQGRRGGLFLSAETAPLFSYLTKSDERLHHMGSHSVGWMLGGDAVRVGPIATAGMWVLGGGVRLVARVGRDRHGSDHHLDLRAIGLVPSAPAGQLMVLYGVSFDPWR